MIRRVLPVVMIAPLCLYALPTTAAHASASAAIHADPSEAPGRLVRVTLAAPACAGGVVRVGERYLTTTGRTQHQTVLARVNASGHAVVAIRVAANAAKTAIGAPIYWTATGATPSCAAQLQGVAASTAVPAIREATVSVNRQGGRTLVTVNHCVGGVATAYTVDSALRPHPVAGLRADRAGSVQHSFVPSSAATALYLDCAQATVPGYAAGGIVLSGKGGAASSAAVRTELAAAPAREEAASARSGAGSSAAAAADVAAKEPCAHAVGPYAFPSLCGGDSLVSAIDAFRTSPSLHAIQGNLQFHRDVLDKLVNAENLLREHPAPQVSARGSGTLRAAGPPAASISYHSQLGDVDGSVTYSQVTYTSPEGGISTTTTAGVDVSVTVNETVNRKWHLSFSFDLDFKTHQTQCPNPNGDVSYATDGTASINFKLAEPVLHIVSSAHFSGHGSATVLVHTNDEAQFHAADLSAAAEADVTSSVFIFSGTSHSQSNTRVSTTEFQPDGADLGKALFDALRVGDTKFNQGAGNLHTFNPGGPTLADWSTAVLLVTVLAATTGAESAATTAYAELNTNAACLKIDIPGDTSVGVGTKHTFTVNISDKAGGTVTIPVQLTPEGNADSDGTMDPDHFEFKESAPQRITLTAPQRGAGFSAVWHFKGLSKRGRLNDGWQFSLIGIGAVTVSGTATVSDSDTCTTAHNGGCDSLTVTPFATVDRYSRRFSSSLSLLAHLPAGDNLNTAQQGTGTVNESGISESGSGTWTDSLGQIDCNGDEQCECTQSGSWTEKQTDGAASGDLIVQGLLAQRDGTGAISDLRLDFAAQADDQVDGAYVVTSASSQPPSPQCQPGSYDATLAAGFGGTDLQLAVPGPITGWTINADWDPKTGGTLATTTVTGSADLSQLDGDDSGPVDASLTMTVSTAPSSG